MRSTCIHLALASGRDRAWGWRAVALARLMSNAPDWDGLTLLVDMASFDRGHRVWGHNLAAIGLVSVAAAAVLSRWDVFGRVATRATRLLGRCGLAAPGAAWRTLSAIRSRAWTRPAPSPTINVNAGRVATPGVVASAARGSAGDTHGDRANGG